MLEFLQRFLIGIFYGALVIAVVAAVVLIVAGIGVLVWDYTQSQPLTGAACVALAICLVFGLINAFASHW